MKFDIPSDLEKFYDPSKVDVYELKYTHELNKLNAKERLKSYLQRKNMESGYISDSLVTQWMIHLKALELALNEVQRLENEKQEVITRAEWEKENTCQYCKAVQPLAWRSDLGYACLPCHEAGQLLTSQSYLTPERVKSISRKLGLKP